MSLFIQIHPHLLHFFTSSAAQQCSVDARGSSSWCAMHFLKGTGLDCRQACYTHTDTHLRCCGHQGTPVSSQFQVPSCFANWCLHHTVPQLVFATVTLQTTVPRNNYSTMWLLTADPRQIKAVWTHCLCTAAPVPHPLSENTHSVLNSRSTVENLTDFVRMWLHVENTFLRRYLLTEWK